MKAILCVAVHALSAELVLNAMKQHDAHAKTRHGYFLKREWFVVVSRNGRASLWHRYGRSVDERILCVLGSAHWETIHSAYGVLIE